MATRKAPAAGRVGAAANVLDQLAALAPTKEKPKAGSKVKVEMDLTPEAAEDARRWIEAKAVAEPVDKRLENCKDEFKPYALKWMAQKLFQNKSRPSNPVVVLKKENGTVDHQFLFMMTDKFKLNFGEIPEGADVRDYFVKLLKDTGLRSASTKVVEGRVVSQAEMLVDNELDFMPIVGLRSLTELLEGFYGEGREWIDSSEDEKEAGRKLSALLLWDGNSKIEALTPEEKALVVKRNPGVQVKAGFYDRVAGYCDSLDELLAVFKVISPIAYPSYHKFAMNDSDPVKADRKIAAAASILGTVAVKEE